jgi:hypothetical protein
MEYLVYPCFCLCLGLEQMTRTTPLRRTILQFRQIFFTEALTFIVHSFDLDYSQAEAAADARRQRVKLYSGYCEPFATQQMRPNRPARRVK